MTPESGNFEKFGKLTILPPERGSIEKEIDRIIEAGPREQPLHVIDLDDVVQKHINWLRIMPRITPFYAVKCNDDPAILATLARLGTGFDCATEPEIRTILELGVEPERILFAHPIKSLPALAFARAHGIKRMTFDNECELEKVAKEYPDAELVLRIRHDDDRALIPLGRKFGCDARGDGLRLMDRAQELGVKVIGVSFHVGCGSLDADSFYHAIESVRVVFDYAQSMFGVRLELVDIGGGFPGDNDKPIQPFADAVRKGLQEFFPNPEEVNVIAEPGRYYVGSAVTLLSTIQGKKVIYETESGERDKIEQIMYYINDGVFGTLFNWLSLRQINDLHRVVPLVMHKRRNEPSYRTTIWGPTCNSNDMACEDVDFPEHQIGDYILFDNLGAYGMTLATNFNGFPKAAVRVYVTQHTW
ncbi:ornithine decarboxylase-like [Anopheles albimanus]|uniref:ornithine decarboxylase n=1 Tax=Anopheles albimanus TaxID=7167 RepID=A0A182FU41_ANOAL|nr:ornithine decarboxylase-like [Anopheles albimanus]